MLSLVEAVSLSVEFVPNSYGSRESDAGTSYGGVRTAHPQLIFRRLVRNMAHEAKPKSDGATNTSDDGIAP